MPPICTPDYSSATETNAAAARRSAAEPWETPGARSLPDSGEGAASASLCASSAGGSSTLSSSGPHRLFRFLFALAAGAGFPGAAAGGLAAGVDPSGVSGGDLRFSPRSGAAGLPVGPALAFRNSSSFRR